jgi:hypothetical protein
LPPPSSTSPARAQRRDQLDAGHLASGLGARRRDRREAVGVLDHQLALEAVVDGVAIELLIPAAKTVTKATTARPIISAAAVTAVRAGLRCVFSRASRPVRRAAAPAASRQSERADAPGAG